MLTNLKLKNFKCFQTLDIDFSNVNILTGINGMGKSTIIQSILLAKQAITDNQLRKVQLNGSAVILGYGKDILYEKAEDCFSFIKMMRIFTSIRLLNLGFYQMAK